MSLNRFGSKRESDLSPSVIAGRIDSALRIRKIERSTGLAFAPVDHSKHFRVQSQLGNSCLGASQAQCIWMWLSLNGFEPRSFPNPLRSYWYGRRRRGEQFTDGGTVTSAVWWALKNYGAVPIGPDFDALRDLTHAPRAIDDLAAVSVAVSAKSIYDSGEKLVLRICDSLAKKQPVQLSLPVERSILDDDGPPLIEAPAETLDLGHAVTAIGCRESSRSGRWPEILIGNSWGHWRDRGTAWLTGEYAAQAYSVRYVEKVSGWV